MYKAIKKSIDNYPKADALCFMGTKYSFADLEAGINKLAASFIAAGVSKGDIVAVGLPNTPQAVFCIYALNKIGAVAAMIHPLISEGQLKVSIEKLKPKLLIVLDYLGPHAAKLQSDSLQKIIVTGIADELPFYKRLAIGFTAAGKKSKINHPKFIRYADFIKAGQSGRVDTTYIEDSEQTALILASGGTTGKEKFVCLSNKNIDTCVMQLGEQIESQIQDRLLTVMPLFHGNGAVTSLQLPLTRVVMCVLVPRFTTKSYVKNLLKYKCNFISGTPSLYERLSEEPLMKKADLPFIKAAFSGADFLSEQGELKINAFLKEHNCPVNVRQGYGLTEGVVISTLIPDGISKPGSVGRPLTGVTLKIVKPNTTCELPHGEVGEIIFSSDTNMQGYYDDEQATKVAMRKLDDGLEYIYSQDLGCVDDDGYLYFKGRIKRVIISNGYNIYPINLENIIEAHQGVVRCCVLGKEDEARGERVVVFIQARESVSDKEKLQQEIIDLLIDNVAKYAMPKEFIFVDEMPLTKINKVDFLKLQEKYF